MGVVKLLEAQDIVNMAVPDKLSMMTYISEIYKVLGRR
jgi:hypothetical protein